MSMAATLGLISKLASSIGGASSLSAIASALKTGAKSNMYALQVDSGEKEGWLVSAINTDANPSIIDPDANGQNPITFSSRSSAEEFITTNNLQYEYSPTEISTISVNVLMEYTSESDENVEKMATDPQAGLAQPCLDKRAECIAHERMPTPADYIQAIKQKMSQWLPI